MRVRSNLLVLIASTLLSLAPTISSAQAGSSRLDSEKMTAVMSVISMLLFERSPPIPTPTGDGFQIDNGEVIDGPIQIASGEQAFAQFDLQDTGIEFCFDVTASGNNPNPSIRVTVNETVLSAIPGADNCYRISEPQQRLTNFIIVSVLSPNTSIEISRIELQSTEQRFRGFDRLTRGEWNERAVRKVLKIFAFGGHAFDAQIQAWADMDAQDAIAEMLNFEKHNFKLSPIRANDIYRDTEQVAANEDDDIGLFTNFSNHIASASANIPLDVNDRDQFGLDGFNFDDGFNRMVTVRGLNPFRQRIGFWETNYHLAVNRDVDVSRGQIATYYDVIMQAHEDNLPYYQVMAEAAKSAAVAVQYGHRFNEWNEGTGECECNDDFAREISQLFFGIFGVDDPDHEEITIPETAKMLTDMPVGRGNTSPLVVTFETDDHHTGDVFVYPNYNTPSAGRFAISGANAAEKIDAFAPIAMQHPESLSNLPVMVISVLADDNLAESDRNELRRAWASLGVNRKLLDFIQAYAISDLFHSSRQRKFFTTHERALYLANKHNFDNLEAYYGGGRDNGDRMGISVGSVIEDDSAGEFFRPTNNVFGGQTSAEASDSSLIFGNNYNRYTDDESLIRASTDCSECQSGQPWEKDWAGVLPRRNDGNFYVADVAEWLWNHVVGNFDNYSELERAHLYTFLATGRMDNPNDSSYGGRALDFNLMMCVLIDYRNDPDQFNNPTLDPPSDGSATILDILSTRRWDDYCRDFNNGGVFEPHEVAALNRVYTSADIANDPDIQATLQLLGEVTLPIEVGSLADEDPDDLTIEQRNLRWLRRNTLERISAALGFIYTTPFVFAEGK